MHGVMSESSAILNSQPCSAEQSMSSNQAFDCCSNSTTIALSSTMPALLHNSKRKRLDAVLTKLSMSNTQKQGECKKEDIEIEPSDLTCSTPDLSELGRDKSPQKQLSVDSEMSMTVGSLKLDIGDEGSAGTTAVSECTSSTLSPTSTTASSEHRPHVKLSQSFSGPSSSVELPQHSGTEFSASSISPLSSLFTPPTSDSAGGTADLDEEDEEHVTEQSDDQVSSKNTVAKSSAKYTLVAEHFFGSPEVGKKQPSLKKSPQAKLLSHDSTEKQCENATIPDAQTRSRMLKSLLPATELVSSSSTIPCTGPLLSKLSYGCFTGDSLPNFPFCKCSHCQSLADQTSSKMPSISHLYSGHSTAHSWSWQNLKQEAVNVPVHCDSFLSLLNSSPNDTYRTQPLSAVSSEKAQRSDLGNIFSPCFLETARPKVPTVSRVTDQSKKRSRSDSDMVSEYLSLSKHLGAYLHQAEPGLILKDGRCVPKPLRSTAHSEHTTPQDSPLDLSVKSLSPHITSPKYSELLAISKRAAFASSSVPSLSSPKSHLSALRASSQSFRLTHNDHRVPHKRRNISSSDSLYSSSLSSVSSLSPLEKHLAESQVAKCLSPLFGMCQEQESVVSTVPFTSDPLVASSTLSVRVSSTQSKVDKSSTKCQEQKAHSLSSLSDLDSSIFTCQICGQTFALHDRLAKHVASRHKNRQQCDSVAKNYLCDVCQRSFARSDMLTRHMRLHTGLKPYTCKICGQVFSRSDHLSTHQRTHTGEKPYKCPQCPYAACRRDMITRHMRTHSRYETPDSSSSTEELSK